jgi:hypothetical protein
MKLKGHGVMNRTFRGQSRQSQMSGRSHKSQDEKEMAISLSLLPKEEIDGQ